MRQKFLLFTFTLFLMGSFLHSQTISTFADGFSTPLGMEVDTSGNIWLTQTGSGNDDGKVSVIAPDGTVNDVITGLPSAFDTTTMELLGAWRSYLMPNDRLFVVSGEGNHQYSGTLLTYDLTGFTLGDTPLTLTDFESAYNIDDYILGMGFSNSNPYSVAWNSAGEMYIVDAGANALLRRDLMADTLSIFAAFPDLMNPTMVGPPFINAVPTKVLSDGADGFYVCNLTGFPFLDGLASVHHVAADDTITDYATGQTLLVDLAVDPTDGELVALQFAEFELGPTGFLPGSAKVVKLFADGSSVVMAEGFGPASGLAFDADGIGYVSSIFTGEVLKLNFLAPDNDNLCNATPLTIGIDCNGIPNISTDFASAQADEPNFTCGTVAQDTLVHNSVWYSFVAPAGPVYLLAAPENATVSNSFQMSLYILNGDCADLTNLELVECNSPPQNMLSAPAVLTTLMEGETYYVSISGRTSTFDMTTFSSTGCMSVIEVSPPANDDACDAINLDVNADPQVFSNLGSTAQVGEIAISPPAGTGGPLAVGNDGWALGTTFIDNSVWFTFTTSADGGNYSIDLLSSFGLPGGFNTQLAVYTATDCNDFGTFTYVGASDNYLPLGGGLLGVNSKLDLFCLPGNTTYHVLVDGGSSFLFQPIADQGYFSIQVTAATPVPLSINNEVVGPDCAGGNDGTIIIAAQGGAGGFTYAWDTGDSTQTLTNSLPSGSYTVTITDMCGEELVETYEVPNAVNNDFAIDAGDDLAGCEESQVQLNVSTTGGTYIDTKRVFLQKSLAPGTLGLIATGLQLPESQDTISSTQNDQMNEMEFVGDALYGASFSNHFYAIDAATGDITLVDSLLVPSVSDLSYVPSSDKLYLTTNDGDIYEVDPTTAGLTLVISTGLADIAQAAIDNSETMYAYTFNSEYYSIPLATGVPTFITTVPFNLFPFRAFETDPWDDKVYLTASTTIAQLSGITWQTIWEVDKTTGERIRSYRDFTAVGPTTSFAIHDRTVAPYLYAWTPADGLDDPAISSPLFNVDQTTTFTVGVSDYCGSLSDELTVNLLPDVETTIDTILIDGEMYNGVVYNADTVLTEILVAANGCDSVVTVNISVLPNSTDETWADDAIQISPNPTNAVLNIQSEGIVEKDVMVTVRDVYGRALVTTPLQIGRMELDVSTFVPGHYFLEIRSVGKYAVRRFVKM